MGHPWDFTVVSSALVVLSSSTAWAQDTTPTRPQEAPEVSARSWARDSKYEVFVDTYVDVNYNFPKPPSPTLTVPVGFTGGNQLRAFDQTDGFALNWVGFDATHLPDPLGAGI